MMNHEDLGMMQVVEVYSENPVAGASSTDALRAK
jgi:hypothetical protein